MTVLGACRRAGPLARGSRLRRCRRLLGRAGSCRLRASSSSAPATATFGVSRRIWRIRRSAILRDWPPRRLRYPAGKQVLRRPSESKPGVAFWPRPATPPDEEKKQGRPASSSAAGPCARAKNPRSPHSRRPIYSSTRPTDSASTWLRRGQDARSSSLSLPASSPSQSSSSWEAENGRGVRPARASRCTGFGVKPGMHTATHSALPGSGFESRPLTAGLRFRGYPVIARRRPRGSALASHVGGGGVGEGRTRNRTVGSHGSRPRAARVSEAWHTWRR
jgi:hypothetical protein